MTSSPHLPSTPAAGVSMTGGERGRGGGLPADHLYVCTHVYGILRNVHVCVYVYVPYKRMCVLYVNVSNVCNIRKCYLGTHVRIVRIQSSNNVKRRESVLLK